MHSLKNRVIVVTGASDGIGKSIALRLAKEKAHLALIARDQDKLRQVATQAGATSENVKYYPCDVRKPEAIQSTIHQIAADFGKIDAVVNNAGIWQKLSDLELISDKVIQDVINTNLLGTILVTKSALPYLKAQKDETYIVNIVSKSGVTAQEGQCIYTASKYGVKGFTDVLRLDLKDTNIHIGAVYQSGTNTDMFRKTGENFPTESFTKPDDLADAVAYMLKCPSQMWIPELHVNYK
jgi:NAD(P)-dependent dehydrogenase (short-subunit alcohol dehydrogenase family)